MRNSDFFYWLTGKGRKEVSLYPLVTNYDLINYHEEKTYKVNRVYGVINYRYHLFTAYNCILEIIDDIKGKKYEGDLIPIFVDNGNEANFSYTVKPIKMENNYETICKVMVDMVYYCEKLTDNSIHYLKAISKYANRFITINLNRELYVSIDNPREGLFLFQNNVRQNSQNVYTLTGDIFTLASSNSQEEYIVYASGENIQNDYMYDYFVTLSDGQDVPIYFPLKRPIRDYLLPSTSKTFFTTVFDFEGYIVINHMNSFGKVCIKLKESLTVENNHNWMGRVNLDTLCTESQIEIEDKHEMVIPITSEMTDKCKTESGCELYIQIFNEDRSNKNHFEAFTFYLQEKNKIKEFPFKETIYGEFLLNDESPQYFRVNVTYEIHSMYIYFERFEDYVDLYINQGTEIPTPSSHQWNITDKDKYYEFIQNTEDVLKGEVFTISLVPKKYAKYKSYFKVYFMAQYPNTEQIISTKMGESVLCYADEINKTCLFQIIVPARDEEKQFLFYLTYPNGDNMLAKSISINQLHAADLVPGIDDYTSQTLSSFFPPTAMFSREYNYTNQIIFTRTKTEHPDSVVFIRVNLPAAALVKLNTDWVIPKTKIEASYFYDNKYFCIPARNSITINFDLKEEIIAELEVFEEASQISIISSVKEIYKYENYYRYQGNSIDNSLTVTNYGNNIIFATLGKITKIENINPTYPEIKKYESINSITIKPTDELPRYYYVPLPLSENINANIYLNEDYLNEQESNEIWNSLSFKGYLTSKSWIDNRFKDHTGPIIGEIELDVVRPENYIKAIIHINTVKDPDISYFVLEISKNNRLKQTMNKEIEINLIFNDGHSINLDPLPLGIPIIGLVKNTNLTSSSNSISLIYRYDFNPEYKYIVSFKVIAGNLKNVENYLITSPENMAKNLSSLFVSRKTLDNSFEVTLNIGESPNSNYFFTINFDLDKNEELLYELKFTGSKTNSIVISVVIFILLIVIIILAIFILYMRRKLKRSTIEKLSFQMVPHAGMEKETDECNINETITGDDYNTSNYMEYQDAPPAPRENCFEEISKPTE